MTLETGLTLAVITLTPIAVIREWGNGVRGNGVSVQKLTEFVNSMG